MKTWRGHPNVSSIRNWRFKPSTFYQNFTNNSCLNALTSSLFCTFSIPVKKRPRFVRKLFTDVVMQQSVDSTLPPRQSRRCGFSSPPLPSYKSRASHSLPHLNCSLLSNAATIPRDSKATINLIDHSNFSESIYTSCRAFVTELADQVQFNQADGDSVLQSLKPIISLLTCRNLVFKGGFEGVKRSVHILTDHCLILKAHRLLQIQWRN